MKTYNIKMAYSGAENIEEIVKNTIDEYYAGGMVYKGNINNINELPTTYKEGDMYIMIDDDGNSWPIIAITTRNTEGLYEPLHWQEIRDNNSSIITADKVLLKSDIQLSGVYSTVGNLDKNAVSAENRKLEQNQSLQSVLEEMLSKELYPVPVAPNGLITLTNSKKSVEVGEEIVISYQFTFNDGKFKYDDNTFVQCEGVTPSYFIKNGEEYINANKSGTLSDLTFVAEDSKTYKVEGKIIYNDSNKGVTKPSGNPTDIFVPAGEIKVTSSESIITYRNMFYFCGKIEDVGKIESITSADIRNSGGPWISTKVANVLEISGQTLSEQTGAIMVAIPDYKSITEVIKSGGGLSMNVALSEFVHRRNIKITGANEKFPIIYKLYVYNPSNLASDTYKITIK